MNRKLLTRLVGGVLVLTASQSFAQAFDEMNATLYLQTDKSVNLFLPTVYADGKSALTVGMKLPEESIVAVDIEQLNKALTYQQISPERVNLPFIPEGKSAVEKSTSGWVCGLRVVDVLDEDLRSSDKMDRTDFCMSLSDLNVTSTLPSNGEAVQQSFAAFKTAGDLSYMNSLASFVEREREDREKYGIVEKAAAETVISPLKNCSRGCLVATSEYGMRRHPILKVRRLHKGIDLRAAKGTPVVSALSGKVLATRTERNRLTKKMSGYGNYVIVIHPANNMETLYAHLSEFKTKAGTNVTQGDLIALSGNTGIGTAAHLHFETHIRGKKGYVPTNPRSFIGSLLGSVAALLDLFSFKV